MNKMKKLFWGLCFTIMILGVSVTSYAAEEDWSLKAREIQNVTMLVEENLARATGAARGRLISSVALSIEDLGGGTAQLYGEVLCHEKMKKIRLNLMLDKWIPEDNDWSQQEKFEFAWAAEDFPDNDLTLGYAYVNVPNLERGENYRARCLAGAWDLQNKYNEAWSEKTERILIE